MNQHNNRKTHHLLPQPKKAGKPQTAAVENNWRKNRKSLPDIMPEEFKDSNDKVEILQQENMKQLEKDQSKETPNESTQQQENPPPTTPAKKNRKAPNSSSGKQLAKK